MHEWRDQLHDLCDALNEALIIVLERRVEMLRQRATRIRTTTVDAHDDMALWLFRRATDDLISAIEDLVDLGGSSARGMEVPVLLLEAARLAPGDARTYLAQRALERHPAKRPTWGEHWKGLVGKLTNTPPSKPASV